MRSEVAWKRTPIALGGMYLGDMRLQKWLSAQAYKRLLQHVLFLIALVQVWRGGLFLSAERALSCSSNDYSARCIHGTQ